MIINYFAIGMLAASLLFSAAQDAQAFYNPQTGCWPSRDPLVDSGFSSLAGRKFQASAKEVQMKNENLNSYAFVKNDALQHFDLFGLDSEPDVSWAPAPCPIGDKTIFIQTLYGGWGTYKGPRVDDGGAGFLGGGSKGCPDYPSFGMPGVFQDTPSGSHGVFTGPVHFIVCRVCLRRCCPDEWRIRSIGPCIYWKKGDKGDLSTGGFTEVNEPPQTWQVALDQDYPTVAAGLCYKCLGKK